MTLSPRKRWLLFALALSAGVLNLIDRQIIAVLKPTIAADLGWTDNDYGTLAAWFQLGAAFGFLVAGWLVDRLGIRRANLLGVGAWSLAAMAHGWARGFSQFVACRIALGATEAMGTPAGIKTIATLFSAESRATGFGLANATNSVGAIVAPLIIPLVAAAWGWRAAFWSAGALGLGWALVWLWATHSVDLGEPAVPGAVQDHVGQRSFLLERRSWTIGVAKVLSDATWWLMLFWMPDYFHRQFGLSGPALGPPLALAYAGAAAGSLIAGQVSSYLAHRGWQALRIRKSVMLMSALCVVPVPLALHVAGYGTAVAIMALTLAGHQGFSTSLFALITDITPRDKIGRVAGFGAFCGNMGGTAIAKISGLVLSAGLGFGPLFAFASVSYLLALGWLVAMLPQPETFQQK